MTKIELTELVQKTLADLSPEEIDERLTFYLEMIDDRMEDGLSEAEAIEAIGGLEGIALEIATDLPETAKVEAAPVEKPKRRRSAWEIALLALGSPLWFPLLIAAAAVVFAILLSVWAIVIALWAIPVSFVCCVIGGVAGGIFLMCTGHVFTGLALLGAGLVLGGLSILAYLVCKAATRGVAFLTKRLFSGKEKA